MFDASLSIDLGASFTKIAWRRACRPVFGRSAVEIAKVLSVDGSALIPSVGIRTGRPEQPWVFGQNAAGLRPGPKMEVFRNWKASLFQAVNDRDSAAAAVVAENFFRWLRSEVLKGGFELGKMTVNVAMPAFEQFEENAAIVLRCMSLAGWDDVTIRRVTEPHANLLGLMASGISAAQTNRAGEPFVNYGKMFGHSSHWVRAARDFALYSRGSSRLGILVLDIGAFTTDFAHLVFDFADDDHLSDGLTSLRQTSVAHGVINQLDKLVFAELARLHSLDWSVMSMAELELLKQSIYAGRTYELVTQDGRSLSLGDVKDRHMIDHLIEEFTAGAWEKAHRFVGQDQVHLAYLTGGGSLVPTVRKGLFERLQSQGIRPVNLPTRAVLPEDTRWRPWTDADGGLERLATALGGTSVVLDVAKEPASAGHARVPVRQPPPPRVPKPVSCRCGGLNPDCSFCGGRGYV